METNQQNAIDFKHNTTDGVFALSKRIFKKGMAIYLLYYILSILVAGIGVGLIFGSQILQLLPAMKQQPNSQAMIQMVMKQMDLFNLGIGALFTLLFVVLVILLFVAWLYHAFLLLANEYALGKKPSLGYIMSHSFGRGLWRMAFLLIIIIIYYVVGFFICGALSHLSWILGFLGFLAVVIFGLRLLLTPPAYVLSNRSLGTSLKTSLNKLSWKRGIVLFLMFIGFFLLLMVAALFLYLIKLTAYFLGTFGDLISVVVQFLFSSYYVGLIASLLIGLYYNHNLAPLEEETDVTDLSGEMPAQNFS